MTTKFDVQEEVYLKARIVGIDIDSHGIRYDVISGNRQFLVYEEEMVKQGGVK